MTKNPNNPKHLSLVTPFIGILLVVGVIAGALKFLSYTSTQRQERIRVQYTTETEEYIERNRDALTTIFASDWRNSFCEEHQQTECMWNTYNRQVCFCNILSQETVGGALSDDITDFSSMVFLKYDDLELVMLKLSGELELFYSSFPQQKEKEQEINQLFSGEVTYIKWSDYTSEFPGKEVIVPFATESGKPIGAIVRGVIEK